MKIAAGDPINGRKFLVAAAVFAASLFLTLPCQAAIVVTLSPQPVTPGQSSTLNVMLSVLANDATLGGYDIRLTVPTGSGISLTGVTQNPGTGLSGYISLLAGGSPIVVTESGGSALRWSDSIPSALPISAGTYRIGRVTFAADPLAQPGTVPLSFDPVSSVTAPTGGPLFFQNSTISVVAAAVPEPSSLLLLGLCGLAAAGVTWRKVKWPKVSLAH